MKKHIIILLIAVATLIIFIGGYRWGYDSVITLRQSVINLDANVQGKQELLARSGTEVATVLSLIQDETIINGYMVTNISIVKFLNVFEAIGRATGAAVSVVSVSKSTQNGRPVFAISISAQGSFAQVMNTVGAIETMPYYITTNMVSLSNASLPNQIETGTKTHPWSASMSLSVASATVIATTTKTISANAVSTTTKILSAEVKTLTSADTHTTP